MNKIKICAISDLHGFLPEITEPADIFLIAGDTLPLECQFNKPKSKEWLEGEFADWINSLPFEKIFMVAGNHDFYFQSISAGNRLSLSQACKGLVYLKNEIGHYYDSNGLYWSIFGTPYCHIYGNWAFMRDDDYMREKFKKIPDKVDIIISHDPPFACGDIDVILETPRRMSNILKHLGNEPLRERISNVDYKLLVCGHIHGGDHNFNNGWKTVNVSHLNEDYEPHYPPFYFELEK